VQRPAAVTLNLRRQLVQLLAAAVLQDFLLEVVRQDLAVAVVVAPQVAVPAAMVVAQQVAVPAAMAVAPQVAVPPQVAV